MSVELKTISIRKWAANYGGNEPTLDSSNNIRIGDIATDTSTTPNKVWTCYDNASGVPVWVLTDGINIKTSTSNVSATITDYVICVNTFSSNVTVTLPTAVGNKGKVYIIKKIDSSSNLVSVVTTSSQTIDGELTQPVSGQYNAMQIVSDNSNWYII